MDIARFEISHLASAPRRPHFVAGIFEVVGIDEFGRAMPDHVFRPVSENAHSAGADLNEISRGIRHQDQILRGFEDAPPFLDFLIERRLRAPAFGDVARDLRGADDRARRRADRRDTERDLHLSAVLAQPRGFMLFDRFTPPYPGEDILDLGAPLRRHDDVDGFADGFRRGESEQAFGGPVPGGDCAVELLRDDGVVG